VKKTFLFFLTVLSLLLAILPWSQAAETIQILNSTPVVGQAFPIENFWKGNIPTKITYPVETFSQKLEFPIQGSLPYSTLADKLNGVDVYFEIWAQSGKKLAYDTVYSFDWNPVGPNTLVSMYIYPEDVVGTHTMLIRTEARLSNTGLISRYIKGEIRIPIQIIGVSKPGKIDRMSAKWNTDNLEYTLTTSGTAVKEYEIGLSYLLVSTSDKTLYANYSAMQVIKKVSDKTFTVSYQEQVDWLKKNNLPLEGTTIMLRARGINEGGIGDWGYGLYINSSDINRRYESIIAEAKKIAEAEAKAKADALAKAEMEAREKAALERDAKMPPGLRPSSGTIKGNNVEVILQTTDVKKEYTKIESGIQYLLDPKSNASWGAYSPVEFWSAATDTTFLISINDLRNFLQPKFSDISSTSLRFVFRGVNEFGTSDWGQTISVSGEILFPVEANIRKQAEAANQKITITCIKGKTIKKVTAVKPKCPKGYKKK
jgi:hypothetical protein